jgi:glyoxylase-like metal-dependent hydrolase (beta-lactamase superfamily II)
MRNQLRSEAARFVALTFLEDFMRRWGTLVLAAAAASTIAAGDKPPGTLDSAIEALGADHITSIEYTGTGQWYQFGQEASPTLPPPEFDVSGYTATIDYAKAAKRVQMASKQTVDPNRLRFPPREGRADEYVAGDVAWITGRPGGPATGLPVTNVPDAKNVEERAMEIWATPQGFLRAAAANHATSAPTTDGGTEVTFMMGKHKFVGKINAQNEVQKLHTWISTPVLGDTLCEAAFTGYRDFGGVMFPSHIVRTEGGKLRLVLAITSVKVNPDVHIPVPEGMRAAMAAPVVATAEKLADGVYWIKGGQWHSVAIDQADHIVVVDAPLDEARSLAVIAKVKATIPNKPIKYLINTHAHFDHAGGLRTYVDEGATIVTMPMNQAFYERAWREPRRLNPDRLEQSKKTPKFEAILNGKAVLSDGRRTIEIHEQVGTAHNDAIVMVYLPREKLLIQADAWNTEAVTAPYVDTIGGDFVNPYMVNLYENILRLKLDVGRIVPLHGPRTATVAELRKALLLE